MAMYMVTSAGDADIEQGAFLTEEQYQKVKLDTESQGGMAPEVVTVGKPQHPQDCSQKLIALKDTIHRRWYNAQAYPAKQKQLDDTIVLKPALDAVLEKAYEALNQAKDCQASEAQLAELARYVGTVEGKIKQAELTENLGQQYYKMPNEVAQELFITDINRLANAVHLIGSSFFIVAGEYGGCALSEDNKDTRELNNGVLSYCEGVSKPYGGINSWLMERGTRVEHKLGAHKATLDFAENEDGYGIAINYDESGDQNWETRQAEARGILEGEYGATCEIDGTNMKCKTDIKDPAKIRELAGFLSRLQDLDLLEVDCIGRGAVTALETAKKENERLNAGLYKSRKGVYDVGSWADILGCRSASQARREEESRRWEEEGYDSREAWEQARQRRAVWDAIEYSEAHANKSFDIIRRLLDDNENPDRCRLAYDRLLMAMGYGEEIEDKCDRVDDEVSCERIAKNIADKAKKLAPEVIAECPPVPQILHEEQQGSPYHVMTVKRACELAENDECVTVANQTLKRLLRGDQPTTLDDLVKQKANFCVANYPKSFIAANAKMYGVEVQSPWANQEQKLQELCQGLVEKGVF